MAQEKKKDVSLTEKKKTEKNTVKQKIRIKLKAFDHRVIDQSAGKIVDTAHKSGAKV